MFTIDPEAFAYATAKATISVRGHSLAQIEMDALEIAADFFGCSRDEIVLTAPPDFTVEKSEGEYPFRPKEWLGEFRLAHVSVERRNAFLSRADDDDE